MIALSRTFKSVKYAIKRRSGLLPLKFAAFSGRGKE
jgi:hypothetical protein